MPARVSFPLAGFFLAIRRVQRYHVQKEVDNMFWLTVLLIIAVSFFAFALGKNTKQLKSYRNVEKIIKVRNDLHNDDVVRELHDTFRR